MTAESSSPERSDVPPAPELFPFIRVLTDQQAIEIDAYVSPLVHDPSAPVFYLEQVVCTPISPELAPFGQGWSMEHESLLVTKARPSHVHAALLLLGFEPGAPGTWTQQPGQLPIAVQPTGPEFNVRFIVQGADSTEVHPSDWIVHLNTKEHFPRREWVFSGADIVRIQGRDVYEADIRGTLVGLTTFGSEVLAWPFMISPSADIDEPVWIADISNVPPNETPVVIRITAFEEE